jgi:hypothetical protein
MPHKELTGHPDRARWNAKYADGSGLASGWPGDGNR